MRLTGRSSDRVEIFVPYILDQSAGPAAAVEFRSNAAEGVGWAGEGLTKTRFGIRPDGSDRGQWAIVGMDHASPETSLCLIPLHVILTWAAALGGSFFTHRVRYAEERLDPGDLGTVAGELVARLIARLS